VALQALELEQLGASGGVSSSSFGHFDRAAVCLRNAENKPKAADGCVWKTTRVPPVERTDAHVVHWSIFSRVLCARTRVSIWSPTHAMAAPQRWQVWIVYLIVVCDATGLRRCHQLPTG
jgi:hypothetical protein